MRILRLGITIAAAAFFFTGETLQGQVANDGQFWMSANYDLPMSSTDLACFAVGKVKFQNDSFDPKSISGKLYFVSEEITSAANLKFKTKGAPTIVP